MLIQVDDVVAEDTRHGNASRKLFSQRKGHDAKRTKPGRTEEMTRKKNRRCVKLKIGDLLKKP